MSPFPEMTFRFPPFYKVFGKDIMRSGRGGRKFESCRLDDGRILRNALNIAFLRIFLYKNTARILVLWLAKVEPP